MLSIVIVLLFAAVQAGLSGDENRRGFGSVRAKSLALTKVSVQPPPTRVNDLFVRRVNDLR